jgi:hypothetical protein
MFTRDTVIIVGAGGSVEYGFPSGVEIMNDLLKENQTNQFSSYNKYKNLLDAPFDTFLRSEGLGHYRQSAVRLFTKAKEMTADSIDLNADFDAETSKLAKVYAVRKILRGAYRLDNTSDEFQKLRLSKNWCASRDGADLHWISQLFNKWVDGCHNVEQLRRNKLRIVTFNYDTVIEDAFLHLLQTNPKYQGAAKDLLPKVYHVHGRFPELPETLDANWLEQTADKIRFVQDTEQLMDSYSGDVDLLNAQQAVERAQLIFLAGFDAHQRNCSLIEINKASADLVALNFDGNPRLRKRLRALGVKDDQVMSGTEQNPLRLRHACKRGFFDIGD